MTIRYDRTRIAVVVVCSCGWQDLGITQQAAWWLASDHEARVHPEQRTVRNAEHHRNRYQAEKSSAADADFSTPDETV